MLKKTYKIYKRLGLIVPSLFNSFYIKLLKVDVKGTYEIRGKIFIRNSGKITFGNKLFINSGLKYNPIGGQTFTSIVVDKGGVLELKENVGISNSSIYCNLKITIEKNVLIGGNCKIYDTDFHSIHIDERMKCPEIGAKSSPIKINKGVFIGAGSTVLKGVTIGENSVIGASSLVSKNIPPNEIWGGNPIVFIKKITKKKND